MKGLKNRKCRSNWERGGLPPDRTLPENAVLLLRYYLNGSLNKTLKREIIEWAEKATRAIN